MTNTILRYWRKEPSLEFKLVPEFPIGDFTSGKVPWDELRKEYGKAVYINHGTELEWKEECLALKDLEKSIEHEEGRLIRLTGKILDSFTIQAQRKQAIDNFSYLETAVYCLLADEEKILLGVRGGSESVGQIIGVPAGAVGFHETIENPILSAVYKEADEEAGILEEEINPKLIGLYRQEPGSVAPSNVFLYLAELNGGDLEEIQKRHAEAYEIYENAKNTIEGSEIEKEILARDVLKYAAKNEKIFPKDAWENKKLITFAYNNSIISKLADFVEKNKFKHSLYAALALFGLHKFGREAYQEIISLPKFKENIESKLKL